MNFLIKFLTSKFVKVMIPVLIIFSLLWFWPQKKIEPVYGLTFSAPYARELGLDPKKVLDAIFDEYQVKEIRLVAYWRDIMNTEGEYDFSDLDWQLQKAKENNVKVILAIGKRVPRWPECHVPEWAINLPWEQQKEILRKYLTVLVNRYKDHEEISMWQVENEPFLTTYALESCTNKSDAEFFEEEIALVKSLDPDRKIMTTDSGELGLWGPSYGRGDVFGSTLYIYLANEYFGDFRTLYTPNFYNYKKWLIEKIYGEKESYLIEISIEPWLTKSVLDTPIDLQLKRMNMDRAKNIIKFTEKTHFENQFLWGVEWWYYLKEYGHPELWDYTKTLFNK